MNLPVRFWSLIELTSYELKKTLWRIGSGVLMCVCEEGREGLGIRGRRIHWD